MSQVEPYKLFLDNSTKADGDNTILPIELCMDLEELELGPLVSGCLPHGSKLSFVGENRAK